ncbi:MAG: ribonuclease P protein component [Lysobacteraceae bacterium]
MHGFGFPRTAHIRASDDFSRCFATGRRAGGRYFRCVFRPADADGAAAGARLGLAISRKVDPRAVERNRIKRLVREWFRHQRHGFAAGDLVVTGKSEARGVDSADLFADLDGIARRLALMRAATAVTMPGSSRPSADNDGS